jgi:hypothetical protein
MTVGERPDLSLRTGLSKSVLTTFEWCQTEAWWKLHSPLPFVTNEKVVFGSAVDRGVEVYITAARAGLTDADVADLHERAWSAAWEKVVEDEYEAEIDTEELTAALRQFNHGVIPAHDWTGVRTQAAINVPIDGLGECDGHPDVILASNAVWDVKTGSPKQTARTLELGFYALLVEAETGQPVPEVGYIFWNRKLKQPKWDHAREAVTDEFRRWAYEGAAAYVRAKKADEALNAKAATPQNYSFPGGPSWAGKCATCVYAPVNGGPCARAYNEELAA